MGSLLWLYQFLCFLILFHLHFLATCSSSSTQLCPHDQSFALLQFKHSLSINSSASFYYDYFGSRIQIASYPKTNSWKESIDCCSWDGVACDDLTGNVIGLDLSCNGLYGTIPPNSSLFLLPHLKSLNLAFNDFRNSRIPSQFGWFVSLTHLNLSNSWFSGQVPSKISHLFRLISLDLSSYFSPNFDIGKLRLKLETPTLNGIVQNLTEVRELFLKGIDMSSVAPSSLMNLSSSLTSLSLGDCKLRGNFPSNIFYRPKLKLLSLRNNYDLNGYFPKSNWSGPLEALDVSNMLFSGELPESIGNLKSLMYLNLFNCNFTGSIPSSLKNLEQLTSLVLAYNNFRSPILDIFGNLKKLYFLMLEGSNFGGQLPSSIFNLSQLIFLDVSYNQLVGSIPYHISGLPNLFDLDLSVNLLNGTVPSWLYTLPSLQILDLSHNQLTCDVNEFQNIISLDLSHNFLTNVHKLPWRNLTYLNLDSNLLQGPIPIPSLQLEFFSVSHNKFTGEISSLICNASSLMILDFSHNNLSGMLPRCIGNFSEKLLVLDFQMNYFHGTIPTAFSKGCGLRYLNLDGNQFDGSLPQSLVNCRNLEILDLGNNNIEDNFPYWLGSVPELQVLVLRYNKFHGYVQGSKANTSFPKLQIFDLSNNDFEGPLPTEYIKNLNAMMEVTEGKSNLKYMGATSYSYDYSVTVTLKNIEIELVKIITIFASIDLSNNKFEGEIPEVIGMLNSLEGLNFSHNRLTGDIPPSMGKLTNLEGLDLSSNKLVGEIPRQLADLTFLSFLNVSQNRLVGSIPRGKQFNTFENDSYAGNLGLCGFPLLKTCKNDEPQQPLPSTFQEEDDSQSSNGFGWKVVLMGYGCGMVFGMAMGYLVFQTGKPKWFVMLVEGKQHQKTKSSKRNPRRSGGRRN